MVSAQKDSLPLQVQQCVDDLLEHVARIEANIAEYDRILSRMAKTDHRSQKADGIEGRRSHIMERPVRWSPVSVTHMILRMDASWQPGWALRHRSTAAAESRILADNESWRFVSENISGSGGRSVLIGAEKKTDSFSRWVCSLIERRGYWRAVVARSPSKTQGCAGHHCITVMMSGCTQPAKARNKITICSAIR